MNYPGYNRLPLEQLSQQVAKNDFNITANIQDLFGFGESYSEDDIVLKYMPIAKMLANLAVHASQTGPYIIGLAGSVAVGKSTIARIIKYLLENYTRHDYKVALVPTDGFLYSNEYLAQHNLEDRKGFPESYDMKKLLSFLTKLKQGESGLKVPCYSHHIYDIVKNKYVTINKVDIVILEGLNVLQQQQGQHVGNLLDFGMYIDANTEDITSWFLTRFMMYRDIAKNDPSAYFYNFRNFSDSEATRYATGIWENINLVNLKENILPSRNKADLIVAKDSRHSIESVYLKEQHNE